MRILSQLALSVAIWAAALAPAFAQDPQAPSDATRPASNTIIGDTGLWFVPLAETMPKGQWSAAAQRTNVNRSEGFVNTSDIGGMFGFGVTDHVEVFGAFSGRRIDADLRPVTALGQPQNYLVNSGWSTGAGDLTVGAKVNLIPQSLTNPIAFGIRAAVKLPTASRDSGLGTGKADVAFDLIMSREFGEKVDLGLSAGLKFRGSPEGYSLAKGFPWGIGVGFPSRSPFRVIGEMTGEALFTPHDMTYSGPQSATTPPLRWLADATRDIFGGVQYQTPKGFYIGAGVNYAASHLWDRKDFFTQDKEGVSDKIGFQVRIGYHPGTRNPTYVAPTAPEPAPSPAPAPVNRPPTVRATCEPCTVAPGGRLTVTADGQDPDGDTLQYKWSGPTGTFASPAARQTEWTAPGQPGGVPLTVSVDDGKGGQASDTVTVQVVSPARREFTFEDVHFDFDRYSLRPEATRVLDEAIKAMTEDNTLRITVEGHTCNIGTTEYNLALGERRANAVKDYLSSRGIDASRLQTVSYGEERPKFDNSREETRRLNRRAALTIRLQ